MSVIFSCSTDDPESSPKETHYVTAVYVTGYERKDLKYVAKIWKNATEQVLSDGSNSATAYSVAVHNGHVSVSGDEYIGNTNFATIWKDGNAERLAEGASSYGSSICLSEKGVYVAGGKNNDRKMVAKLWKSRVSQILTDDANNGFIQSAALSGDDVFTVGYGERYNSNGRISEVAKLWKRGAVKNLPGYASSILVIRSEDRLRS
ncbi:MAG: hypothetical protein ACRDE7_03065 [Sphingobacterium sp.]